MLDGLLARLQPGDTLVVAALDRLGRSLQDVLSKIEPLLARGVILISDRERLDFNGSTGRFIMSVLLAAAQFERDIIAERTKQGLKRVKAEGRGKFVDDKQWQQALALVQSGVTVRQAARLSNISAMSLSRRLRGLQ